MSKRGSSVETVKNPRKIGEHVRAAMDYLEEIGASDASVIIRKHLRINFKYRGEELWFMLSTSPKSPSGCANISRQLIRRAIRDKFGDGAKLEKV